MAAENESKASASASGSDVNWGRTLYIVGAGLKGFADSPQPQPPTPSAIPPITYSVAPMAGGGTCFKTGESAPSGFNKICYYNCTGSAAAETFPSTSICPLTINR